MNSHRSVTSKFPFVSFFFFFLLAAINTICSVSSLINVFRLWSLLSNRCKASSPSILCNQPDLLHWLCHLAGMHSEIPLVFRQRTSENARMCSSISAVCVSKLWMRHCLLSDATEYDLDSYFNDTLYPNSIVQCFCIWLQLLGNCLHPLFPLPVPPWVTI